MNKKLLLALFALVGLVGCQQNEIVEVEDQTFGFTIVEDGVTRSGSQIDVISLCADSESYFSAFNVKKDRKSWSDYKKNAKFFAHYPQLPSEDVLEAEREVTGGSEYLFSVAEAESGSDNVSLKFKNMAAQIVVKIVDAEDEIKSAKIKLKNKGVQNLKTGVISTLTDVEDEYLVLDNVIDSDEVMGYALPQTVSAGTVVEVELANGITKKTVLNYNANLIEDNIIKVEVDYGAIIDPDIPL